MEKNSLKYTGLLAFIVWGALLLMHLLPSITMGSRVLRRVDILGDVRRPSKPVSEPDILNCTVTHPDNPEYVLNVEILASAIQSTPANAVTEAWGVTPVSGN